MKTFGAVEPGFISVAENAFHAMDSLSKTDASTISHCGS